MSKYRVGGKSKNDNRVDLCIGHLGVGRLVDFVALIKIFLTIPTS